jgi:hypothetical protein
MEQSDPVIFAFVQTRLAEHIAYVYICAARTTRRPAGNTPAIP